MDKFTVVRGIAAPLMMPNITTDALSPTAAGQIHLGRSRRDAVRKLALRS